jgi:DNA-binding Xre family transcriptional regulator
MQKELEVIKSEVTDRLRKEFVKKFAGNNLQLAKAAGCNEKAIRLLFNEGSGMTLNLLFKLCSALEIHPSDVLKGLDLKKK